MGRVITNITNRAGSTTMRRIRPIYRHVWGGNQLYITPVVYAQPQACSTVQGKYAYEGYVDSNGVCRYTSRRKIQTLSFNGNTMDAENYIWNDLAGSNERQSGVDSTETKPQPKRVWDVADKLLDTAQVFIGAKGYNNPSTNTPLPNEDKGMSGLAVVGVVAGVAIVGYLIYRAVK